MPHALHKNWALVLIDYSLGIIAKEISLSPPFMLQCRDGPRSRIGKEKALSEASGL
jgi:hypothetical protein